MTNCVVLTPVIDFEKQIEHKKNLIENIKARQLPIDINAVEEQWNFFQDIEHKKKALEQTRTGISQRMSYLIKQENDFPSSKELDKLKLHLKIVKDDLKHLRTMSYGVEEAAALQVLNLPNVLHPKTPENEELEVYRYLEVNDSKTENHLTIGNQKDAALFERSLQNYFNGELVKLNYLQFSNSDLVKSVVVEGCGGNPFAGSDVLTLEDIHCVNKEGLNRLHLVGGSSFYSFMVYFTKHFLQPTHFPIKAFCVGQKYQTVDPSSIQNVFNLNQSSEIGLFRATNNSEVFEHVLEDLLSLYKPLGYHFRVALLPANKLNIAESLRISIQMFSNHLQTYIEVGYVSFYEDFISKRLLLNWNQNGVRKFSYLTGGSLVNIHKVIGIITVVTITYVDSVRRRCNVETKDTGVYFKHF
ncbi:hypothetical protein HUJ04_010173 [Dendroctonus ponderosae]|nr:hypothetical protein HUJ04_010173 [Dendroctonus ponderosae]